LNHPGPFFVLYVFAWLHCVLLYIVYSWLQVHCVFFVVIWIFGVLCHFQQYHGDQFTKPGANARHIGDGLVWAVRSNDLTHWTTWDVFAWLHCVSDIKHQKFKCKLQQKIHNVPVIKNKQYIIIIHNVIKQKKVPGGSMS
jgi:hypothetical protein